jgi:hypothetical protein
MQDASDDVDWSKAKRPQLLAKVESLSDENRSLRQSVGRLMKRQGNVPVLQHGGRDDDFVPAGWVERHHISIPRSDGFFESDEAWVRITKGTITIAGLKNQSILSLLIAAEKLSPEAERDAKLYMDWRAAFFARIEAARYSNVGSGDPEAWTKEDRFSKLLKAVEREQLRCVDIIVKSKPKERDLSRLNDDPESFLEAFRIAARAISKINKDADAYLRSIRENACASNSSVALSAS